MSQERHRGPGRSFNEESFLTIQMVVKEPFGGRELGHNKPLLPSRPCFQFACDHCTTIHMGMGTAGVNLCCDFLLPGRFPYNWSLNLSASLVYTLCDSLR